MTGKTLIFNFDGTGGEPRDAEQFSSDHFKEDSSCLLYTSDAADE